MQEDIEKQPRKPDRSDLVRDIAILQVKLVVDGLRDLVLVPLSLIAGLISLLKYDRGEPGPEFYRLLRAGKDSEHWINLFGAYRNRPASMSEHEPIGAKDIDDLVARVESYVVDEYRRGDITAQAKEKIDRALAAINRRGGKK